MAKLISQLRKAATVSALVGVFASASLTGCSKAEDEPPTTGTTTAGAATAGSAEAGTGGAAQMGSMPAKPIPNGPDGAPP